MHDYRRLRVWTDSVGIATSVYAMTSGFPEEERFGLTAQMRSAAVSISSNIAEGAGRGSNKEMARFLRIALGSLAELESQLEVATQLGFLSRGAAEGLELESLRKQVRSLHGHLTKNAA